MKTSKIRRAYHHGDLKNALIQAALAHIARDGARALSLREVARSAGVSHTASYRHFRSKESLLAAIAEQGFHRLSDMMRVAMQQHSNDPLAMLRASGVAYVEFGVRYPDHLQVMFSGLIGRHDDYPELKNAGEEAYELLASSVRSAMQAGLASGPSEHIVSLASWALVHGLAMLIAGGQVARDSKETFSAAAVAFQVTGLLQQGIAMVPAQGARKSTLPVSRKRRTRSHGRRAASP
jgi:AcrR family transcriptional regulator